MEELSAGRRWLHAGELRGVEPAASCTPTVVSLPPGRRGAAGLFSREQLGEVSPVEDPGFRPVATRRLAVFGSRASFRSSCVKCQSVDRHEAAAGLFYVLLVVLVF